jgi:hypothetical protein
LDAGALKVLFLSDCTALPGSSLFCCRFEFVVKKSRFLGNKNVGVACRKRARAVSCFLTMGEKLQEGLIELKFRTNLLVLWFLNAWLMQFDAIDKQMVLTLAPTIELLA